MFEGFFCTGALKAYKKSLDLHKQVAAEQGPQANGDTQPAQPLIPARLLNNAAVVFLTCGKHREALDLVIEATQVSSSTPVFGTSVCSPTHCKQVCQLCSSNPLKASLLVLQRQPTETKSASFAAPTSGNRSASVTDARNGSVLSLPI